MKHMSWVVLGWAHNVPREVARYARWREADAAAERIDGETSIEDSIVWDRMNAFTKRGKDNAAQQNN